MKYILVLSIIFFEGTSTALFVQLENIYYGSPNNYCYIDANNMIGCIINGDRLVTYLWNGTKFVL